MTRLISASLLLLAIFPFSVRAADLDVDHALSEVLKHEGVARIEVTLDLNEKRDADRDHIATGSGIHPTVFDIAMMAAPGPMNIDKAGDFHLLRIAANTAVVGKVLEMGEVVALHLDTKPLANSGPAQKSICPSTSTRACLSNNFGISTVYGGVTGKVASVGGDSATFWAYSSNNWEVLGKVLNGCGINNHWWLLGAAAGTSSYTIYPRIFVQGGSLGLPSSTAANKPIVNLQLFSCS